MRYETLLILSFVGLFGSTPMVKLSREPAADYVARRPKRSAKQRNKAWAKRR